MKSVHGFARLCRWAAPLRQQCGPIGSERASRMRNRPRRLSGGRGRPRCRFRQRRRRPGGSSRAAQSRLRSGPGNRRRQNHDGACHILLVRRSSELIKTFGTSHLKQVMQGQLSAVAPSRDQARDRTPSNAWAMKIPAPTRPITAVTISNIANILCAPHEPNDAQARTVKRISDARRTIGVHWGFRATDVPNPSSCGVREWRNCNHSFTTAKRSPFPPCSPCGIFTT
jgi:hypothetical protein